LTLLGRQPFDVAVVDYAMPGMSGVEFVRLAREIQPELRVLFITGNRDMVSADDLTAADRMLSKPYGQADLLSALGSFDSA
jgi:CheY-like chemotaxis protein